LYSEPFYEVMNYCDLSSLVLHLFLPYVFFSHIAHIIYLYRDLMLQVISGIWCACVLATFALVCLRHLVPVVVQHPLDLMGPLLRVPHRLHHS
jgi:hypothetical protein